MLTCILFFVILTSVRAEDNLEQETYFFGKSTLQQVHVVFRHGDRTPDSVCEYLQEPSDNDTYWPIGWGGLTRLGKTQEYEIGVYLRQRYGEFLGNVYTPEVQDARSTDYSRTKMSLQLVLAGLWPPTPEQTWNWGLYWQPVPYSYEKRENDMILGYPLYCKKYKEEYNKFYESQEVTNILLPKQRLFNYVNNHTGQTGTTTFDLFALYFCFYAQQHMGKVLPLWTEPIFPTALEKMTVLEYKLKTYNSLLRKYTGGQLLKKILNDAQAKIMGKLVPQERKMFLYSGHEYNIAFTLRALNAYVPHIPPYASFILIELHTIREKNGFRIFYQNYKGIEPVPIRIPGCAFFCPVEDFIRLLYNNLPGPEIVC